MVCKENQLTEACEKFARFSPTIERNLSIPAFEHRQVEQYLQQKGPLGIRTCRKKRNLEWWNPRWHIKTQLKHARRHLKAMLRIHDIAGSDDFCAPFVDFAFPHILTITVIASLGKYRSAPARVTKLHAAIASINDMDIKDCPNRTFFPIS
jgi:hypothetical protein